MRRQKTVAHPPQRRSSLAHRELPPFPLADAAVATAIEEFQRFFEFSTGNKPAAPLDLSPADWLKLSELQVLAEVYQARTRKPFRIALDMGRVIVMRGKMRKGKYIEGPRSEYHRAPSRKGVFNFVRILVDALGAHNVFLIKGLPSATEDVTGSIKYQVTMQAQMWLVFHQFFDLTGFSRSNVLFARREEKVRICAARSEECPNGQDIQCIVDDRGEVLCNFPETTLNLAFSPVPKEWRKFPRAEKVSKKVYNLRGLWKAIVRYLREQSKRDH